MTKKITDNEFKRNVYNQVGNEYTFLEEYKGINTKISVRHNKCGHVYKVTPNKFLTSKRRCPICAIKQRSKKLAYTDDEIKNLVREIIGNDDYTVIKIDRKHNQVRCILRHECESCGRHEFSVLMEKLKKGQRCPICKTGRFNETRLKNWSESLCKDFKYQSCIIKHPSKSGLISLTSSIILIHSCGAKNSIRIDTLKKISGDPFRKLLCKECQRHTSLAELSVADFLKSKNINFKHNATIDGCKFKLPLKFDFIIYNSNGSINLALEIDGAQHETDYWYSEGDPEEYKIRDAIKKEFCESNNIPFVRFKYIERSDIQKIIDFLVDRFGCLL